MNSIFGGTNLTYASVICYNDVKFETMSIRCQIPKKSISGNINLSLCNLYQGNPTTSGIKICQAFLKDRFENSYGFTLKNLP